MLLSLDGILAMPHVYTMKTITRIHRGFPLIIKLIYMKYLALLLLIVTVINPCRAPENMPALVRVIVPRCEVLSQELEHP